MARSLYSLVPLAALVCLQPAAAIAAPPGRDSGEYVILSAQWGTERHHVDVTERLRQEARRDMMFRVDNKTLGVDPDFGVVKTLRIYARGPMGREQMFEYREGSVVDGAMFRGWSRGEWAAPHERWSGSWNTQEGGEYVIISAQYGTERHHMDVTERLKELARKDHLVRLTDQNLRGDPDFGKMKVLRIYARGANGRERMFEYLENTVLDGAKFRGWERGEWGGPRERWSGRWEGEERDR